MVLEEKRKYVKEFCQRQFCSPSCPLRGNSGTGCSIYIDGASESDLDKALVKIKMGAVEHDIVNHPSHYCREGGMESIDEMVLIFGKEAVKNFCLCNVWKYRYRASDKNGEEDLKKSDWYMRKYKELMEG